MKKKEFLKYEMLLLLRDKVVKANCGGIWISYNGKETKKELNGVASGMHCAAVVAFGKVTATEVLITVYKDGTFEVTSVWNGSYRTYEGLYNFKPHLTKMDLKVIEEYKKSLD